MTAKAYPYPQTLEAVADMSHISIIGIKLLTAEYSGMVGVCISLDDGGSYSEEVQLGDWLNTDVEELWNSLPESSTLFVPEVARRTVVDDDQFDVAQGLSHDRTQGLFDVGLRIVYGDDDADFRVIHRHVSILRVRRHNA